MAGSTATIGLVPPCPPGSALTVSMPCGPRSDRPRAHSVTIRDDWSVDTGHDDAAERVAAALGGYRICRDRLDAVVPALQEAVALWTRRRLPSLTRTGEHWALVRDQRAPRCQCRSRRPFADVAAAAAHQRDPAHLARRHDVDPALLEALVWAVRDAHGGLRRPPSHPVAAWVREPGGLAELWDAGIHPDAVARIRADYWDGDEPLPARFYLAVALLRPPEDHLRAAIAAAGDPDVATWAAWSVRTAARDDPRARQHWLSLRLPRRDVEELLESGRTVADVRRVAELTGLSLREAARRTASWARAGCRPDAVQLGLLARVDGGQVPTGAAVDRLLHELGPVVSVRPGRTVAGLVLAAAGSVPAATRLFAHPHTRPELALLFIDPEGPA